MVSKEKNIKGPSRRKETCHSKYLTRMSILLVVQWVLWLTAAYNCSYTKRTKSYAHTDSENQHLTTVTKQNRSWDAAFSPISKITVVSQILLCGTAGQCWLTVATVSAYQYIKEQYQSTKCSQLSLSTPTLGDEMDVNKLTIHLLPWIAREGLSEMTHIT